MNSVLSPAVSRLLGICLIAGAIFGLLFSIAGVVVIWAVKTPLTTRIEENLSLAHSMMDTTEDGLIVIGDSLSALEEIVEALENTLLTFGRSVDDAQPLVAEIRTIIGTQLPTTLAATQTSVESAQSSAEIIDTVLRTITSIPFFPGDPYAPDVPLNVALGGVAQTLGEIPDSLADTDASLEDLEQNLGLTQTSLEGLSTDIGQLHEQLGEAELVMLSYQGILRDLSNRTQNLAETAPVWLNAAALILTLILIWVLVTQVGLLLQGISLLQPGQTVEAPERDLEPAPAETNSLAEDGNQEGPDGTQN